MGDELQFEKAEYAAPEPCVVCKRTLEGKYFAANGKKICERCHEALKKWPGTPGLRFRRAAIFGAGAGVLGFLLYYGIFELTGMELGLVAIVVGIGVGMAVRKGCYGIGGAGYQTLAIALTYMSISATYYVVLVEEFAKQGQHISAAGYVLLVPFSFAVPFISAASGNVLGLLIVGFGLYEAWKFNRRPKIAITGPFEIPARAPNAG